MNNWILCDGNWINFNHLETICVRDVACTVQYEIIGVPFNGTAYPLFERYFDSREEAHEWIDNFMYDHRRRWN